MDTSDNLDLPYIMPSQAQKHVTHNEAIGMLDALVQTGVADRDLAAPPGAPVNGERYIVAAGASGDWSGQSGKIAHRLDGAWSFYAPRPGFFCHVADEGIFVHWTGSAWAPLTTTLGTLQNLVLLGIGTAADGSNPFSAKLNKALWTARTAADGGDGDLRYTLNKETATDVLSLLLQSGFSGRAELGLIGDDDLALKVSADGSVWTTALKVDRTTGQFTVSNVFNLNASLNMSGGALAITRDGAASLMRLVSYRDTNATHATFAADVARGSLAAPTFMTNTGLMAEFIVRPWDGTQIGSVTSGRLAFRACENHTASARGTRWTIELAPNGGAATVEAGALDHSSGLSLFSATVIDANRHFRLRSYTVGTLPSASPAGQMVHCSDLGGGGGQVNSDGSAWRRVSRGGQQTVSSDADITLTVLTSAEEQRHTGTLTANRTVTLSAANVYAGARFRLTRTGGGAFNLSFGALKNLATNNWAEAVHDGSAWYLAAYGTL
ncbi:DUF2793 domain-containing protein [Mesorhizobium sp. LHD-90]|uniref:DUF2793 domain-containing protein n=1 Tax=Mesorhizobium sp. LHD-90 TaxID=3071414 RepID=UPI0027E1DC0B|nr:DUF2793 domain-containing protein [Mesorhizobium sp. LHD-90]MDQ6436533.1 DUF2793 domain-containing protein [Mesorhizobium sp. LHD-90]